MCAVPRVWALDPPLLFCPPVEPYCLALPDLLFLPSQARPAQMAMEVLAAALVLAVLTKS